MKTIISSLRKESNISQESLAEKLEISRQTLINIENGKRDLTISEIQKLSQIFDIEPIIFLGGKNTPKSSFDFAKSFEKFRQVVLNCINFGADNDNKITKTKLAKLVYLCDFANFYSNLEPMTGMEYKKLPQGPVATEYFSIIDCSESINVIPSGRAFMISLNEKPSTSALSESELDLIKKVCTKWKDKNTDDIVKFTHEQMPWFSCQEGEVIPYELITAEEPENVY